MGNKTIRKLLIANRGEIACRIAQTARKMGVYVVAVASDIDRQARHTKMADKTVFLGGRTPAESYLDISKIIKAAKDTGADAIHPGYGFLSENATFAQKCEKEGIVFIGPSADIIKKMGLKDTAREVMAKAGVPIVPGVEGKNIVAGAKKMGFPVLVKASAGGGGKGMRKVEKASDLKDAIDACAREAGSAFGNDSVFVEKYLECPRHVEVQIFGDEKGNVVHLYERDCSIQRRHQKIVEEAPAPKLPAALRQKIHEAAVLAGKTLGYTNAGTVEFILDASGKLTKDTPFYFMEMNTRLQVEHPVTEMITGLDLVEWQLRIAGGEALPLTQDKIVQNGHAFEVRLYAEDPDKDFAPQTGKIRDMKIPGSTSARFDTGFEQGDVVTSYYDPMLAKLCVHAPDRGMAAGKMTKALNNLLVTGLKTNQTFLARIFKNRDFISASLDTHFIESQKDKLWPEKSGQPSLRQCVPALFAVLEGIEKRQAALPYPPNWRLNGCFTTHRTLSCAGVECRMDITANDAGYTMKMDKDTTDVAYHSFENGVLRYEMDGVLRKCLLHRDKEKVTVNDNGEIFVFEHNNHQTGKDQGGGEHLVTAPMTGRITEVLARNGQKVQSGQPLIRMEAMKIETTLSAGKSGKISGLDLKKDDVVDDGTVLAEIEAEK